MKYNEGRSDPPLEDSLSQRIHERRAVLGVIGLGYVGLPLAIEMARAGYRVLGFDVSPRVVTDVNRGVSHIQDISNSMLSAFTSNGRLVATDDFALLRECDAISICVPTPLSKTRDPDLSYIAAATSSVAAVLRPGQLVILESTTYPGTTREALLPALQASGLEVGRDFYLCFSPERVDPGNPVWHTRNTPKVIGGITPACSTAGKTLYSTIFDTIVMVGSAEAAELVKLHENTFRMINIALANELAQVCDRLNVDVWEVIDAAATKPFGFMKFMPGPGLGGHCIPLDPHYLSWKMRTLSYKTRMIDLSSDINAEMPAFVVRKIQDSLNEEGQSLRGSTVLVLGVAYKKDIDDLRESPALHVMHLLQQRGAKVRYHDPHCPVIRDDGHTVLNGLPMHSEVLSPDVLAHADCVVVTTDHSAVDYRAVVKHARVVVDARGVTRGAECTARIVGLSGGDGRVVRAREMSSGVAAA